MTKQPPLIHWYLQRTSAPCVRAQLQTCATTTVKAEVTCPDCRNFISEKEKTK